MAATENLEEELEKRCKLTGFAFTELIDEGDEADDHEGPSYGQFYGWALQPQDDLGYSVYLRDETEIRFALATRFEHYRYLGKYAGVWSSHDRLVEAEVEFPKTLFKKLGAVETIQCQLVSKGGQRSDDLGGVNLVVQVPTGRDDIDVQVHRSFSERCFGRTQRSVHIGSGIGSSTANGD